MYKNYLLLFLSNALILSGCTTINKYENENEKIYLSNKKEINLLSTKLSSFEERLLELEKIIIAEIDEKMIKKSDGLSNEKARDEYQKSFNLIKLGQYSLAEESLSNFINEYIDSEFIDDAIYWLGESFYSQKKYDRALQEFEKIKKDYPKSEKLLDAILRSGFCEYELGNFEVSNQILNQLMENYPDTSASRLAKEKIKSIK